MICIVVGVALIGFLQRDSYNSTGLQIHGMLSFVRQMGASILHLGDARVRVIRMRPVLV